MSKQAMSSGRGGSPAEESGVRSDVALIWGVEIPMRDGVRLNATVFKPNSGDPCPAIFILTPYIGDSHHPRAMYFARNGYAFALVDCRGRGNSSDAFEPFANDGRDGHDVVEWLAAQPWCTGAVMMWGGSYCGFDQWTTLRERPAHLSTIVPVASAYPGVDVPFVANVFWSYWIRWLTLTSGATPNGTLFRDQSFWIEKFRAMYLSHRPFSELDQIVGNTTTYFQTWLKHATPDEYWDRMVLTPADYDQIDVPILTITGHYDEGQRGAMAYYGEHMRSASPARGEHYLVIGPWDHAGTRTPSKEIGGLTLGDACLVDMNALHREWYDWTLKRGPRPAFLKNRVAYYLTGAEEWKYAESLDAIASARKRFYLDSTDGRANEVFHSGKLDDGPPGRSRPDEYVYDPLDVRPAELEREENKRYLTDQRYVLDSRGDALIYHSAPFDEAIEITGYAKLVAWIALDVPDTDLVVVLSEVLLDGSQIQLTWDWLRARYRESPRQPKLVTPGEIIPYEFTGFTFFSRRIAKGSRLRLYIGAQNSIYSQKNYNSGGVVADETAQDARTARVTLYHDPDHPSYLELPVVQQSERSNNGVEPTPARGRG